MSIKTLFTQKQALLIIAVNAVISILISLIVGLLLIRPARQTPAPTPTVVVVATSALTATTPTPGPLTHIIQSGDTISGLAFKYDVPEADIIAANQLQNPNMLQVGMELIIPVGGLPQITPTWTPQPTPTDTPIPFQPPSVDMTATALALAGVTATSLPTPTVAAGGVQIEITEVTSPGNADREAVVIANKGQQLVDMAGWTLTDAEGNTYIFPNFRLWPGGSVTINTRIGQDNSPPANLFWGKLEPIWSASEIATLKDAAGKTVSAFAAK
jgi:LysM repeat protein